MSSIVTSNRGVIIIITIIIVLVIFAVLIVPNGVPVGDYGDAPDGSPTGYPNATLVSGAVLAQIGNFPTLYSNNGAHTLDISRISLGGVISEEQGADDPNDPDGTTNLVNSDFGDDGVINFMMLLTQIPPPAAITLIANSYTTGDFYLNAVADLNMDGEWGGFGANGEPEWIIKNHRVSATGPGPMLIDDAPPFAYSSGNRIPDPSWMRVALTSESIQGNDWDGTGEFASGEIEDYLVQFPRLPSDPNDPNSPPGSEPKKIPMPVIDCNGDYHFDGEDTVEVHCFIENTSPYGGDVTWTLTQQTANVLINNAVIQRGVVTFVNTPGVPVIDVQCSNGTPVACDAFDMGALTGNRVEPLPSTWSATASVIDPNATINNSVISIGWLDSVTIAEFDGGLMDCIFISSMVGFVEDGILYSNIFVADQNEDLVADALVTVQLFSNGELFDSQTISTDGEGMASYVNNNLDFGEYTVAISDIKYKDLPYTPEKNVQSEVAILLS